MDTEPGRLLRISLNDCVLKWEMIKRKQVEHIEKESMLNVDCADPYGHQNDTRQVLTSCL